jgi:hypothetical protein
MDESRRHNGINQAPLSQSRRFERKKRFRQNLKK